MHWAVLAGAVAALYLYRDAACLPHLGFRRLAALMYAGAFLTRGALLGGLAENLGRDEVLALLQKPAVWGGFLLVHSVSGAGLLVLRRRLPMLAVLLLPAPMEWFAAGGLTWMVLQSPLSLDGWIVGVAVAAVWLALAGLLGKFWGREREKALETAASANLSAILLLGLQVRGGAGAAAESPWQPVSLLPLLPLAGLVGSGWLLHRLRRKRHESVV